MLILIRRLYSPRILGTLIKCSKNVSTICSRPQIVQPPSYHNLQICRYKSKNKNKTKEEDSDSETKESDEDFLDGIHDKHTKTIKVNLTSMRLDVLLKAGLGLSRNKLETIFYESKIRLNGEKVLKKGEHVKEGDEIDVIKGTSVTNKDFLTVARVEVLSATAKEESISVKIRRCKSLVIENYEGRNRWQGESS